MISFNYNELYQKVVEGHHTLDEAIEWLKKASDCREEEIISQVVSETMHRISQGDMFEGPCTHCGRTERHVPINHFMLGRVNAIRKEFAAKKALFFKYLEQGRFEAYMKQLSSYEKDIERLIQGSLWERLTDWESSWVYCKLKGLDYKDVKYRQRRVRLEKYRGS